MSEWKAGRTYRLSLKELDLRLKHLHPPTQSAIESMAASLKKRGQLSPVIAAIEGRQLVLVDGFKRQAAAPLSGLDRLVALTVGPGSPCTKALPYLMNRAKGFSLMEEACLARELVEVDGFKQVEVASLLDHHKSWVHRRLGLIRSLTPEVLEDLRLNLIPPGSAASLARLPKHNQADWSLTIQTHRLRSREVAELVDLWCKAADPGRRKYLRELPREALDVLKERDRQGPGPGLRRLIAIAVRLQQDCQGGDHPWDRQSLSPELIEEAERACKTCFERIRKHLEVTR
jgi:ParB-like chromosome segregation protein Spo0J